MSSINLPFPQIGLVEFQVPTLIAMEWNTFNKSHHLTDNVHSEGSYYEPFPNVPSSVWYWKFRPVPVPGIERSVYFRSETLGEFSYLAWDRPILVQESVWTKALWVFPLVPQENMDLNEHVFWIGRNLKHSSSGMFMMPDIERFIPFVKQWKLHLNHLPWGIKDWDRIYQAQPKLGYEKQAINVEDTH